MSGLRIWHLLVVVAVRALLFAVARFDDAYIDCTPLSPILALLYFSSLLGMIGARWKGRTVRRGLLLGLLLGPLGAVIAFSNPISEEWKEGILPARGKPHPLTRSSPGGSDGKLE